MAKILSVYNRLQAGDYENGNGGKRRVSRLTQFIHATLQMLCKLVQHHVCIENTFTKCCLSYINFVNPVLYTMSRALGEDAGR